MSTKDARDRAMAIFNDSAAMPGNEQAMYDALIAYEAAIIASVVETLRGNTKARPPGTYPAQSNYNNMNSYADFIEREFGEKS